MVARAALICPVEQSGCYWIGRCQRSWDSDLRHLERDVAAVMHDLRANLGQLLSPGGQGPVLDTFSGGANFRS